MIEQTDAIIEPQSASTGFRPKGRYRRVECDWIEADEGSEKLWAEIRSDLPFGVIDDLPAFGSGIVYADLWAIIAPHVRDWNCTAFDVNAGEWADVPPPAGGGPSSFRFVDPLIADWVLFQLKMTYRQAIADPKASTPSAPTESPPSEPVSDSSSREKRSPKNRTASGSSSPGT